MGLMIRSMRYDDTEYGIDDTEYGMDDTGYGIDDTGVPDSMHA